MLLNRHVHVTDAPEMVRSTHAATRRQRREEFMFWRGVLAAQGPPGMSSPLNKVGAKSPPVTVFDTRISLTHRAGEHDNVPLTQWLYGRCFT